RSGRADLEPSKLLARSSTRLSPHQPERDCARLATMCVALGEVEMSFAHPLHLPFDVADHPTTLGIRLEMLERAQVDVTQDLARRNAARGSARSLCELMPEPCSSVNLRKRDRRFDAALRRPDRVAEESGGFGAHPLDAEEIALELDELLL